MEPRRRSVIGPKVRQVGFVTPNADVPEGKDLAPAPMTASSPSPVIIPVARPVIDIPQKTEPVAVPSPSTRRLVNDIEIPSAPTGASFNPGDSVLESSSLPSSRGGLLH